jgi:hypothetical protein
MSTGKQLRDSIPLHERTWLTTREAAAYTALHEATLRRDFPSTLISPRARRFNRAELDARLQGGAESQ